ncbi:hypothetical protein Scep_023461 [Stephania cephalantha]|uniref:Uncharacterized protein n=1 Tax=Stephania cephalantha TaxID=152367 RepID=A0AAP0EVR9_9MAGN
MVLPKTNDSSIPQLVDNALFKLILNVHYKPPRCHIRWFETIARIPYIPIHTIYAFDNLRPIGFIFPSETL